MTHATAKRLAHSDNCIHITYNEIIPNDLVWLCGELFKANQIFCYKKNEDRVVIRFEGECLTNDNLNGTYGATATERATIVKRELI
jgi:hypothetical protein